MPSRPSFYIHTHTKDTALFYLIPSLRLADEIPQETTQQHTQRKHTDSVPSLQAASNLCNNTFQSCVCCLFLHTHSFFHPPYTFTYTDIHTHTHTHTVKHGRRRVYQVPRAVTQQQEGLGPGPLADTSDQTHQESGVCVYIYIYIYVCVHIRCHVFWVCT
jgi:hypothetical protein